MPQLIKSKFLCVLVFVLLGAVCEGQQILQKNYSHVLNHSVSPYEIKQISDGMIITGSLLTSTMPTKSSAFLVKLDSAFNISWSIGIGAGQANFASDIIELPDSSVILSIYSLAINSTLPDLLISRVDKNGNLVWSRSYHKNQNGIAIGKILLDKDGNLLFFGGEIEVNTINGIPGIAKLLIIKTDINGNIISSKVIQAGNLLSVSNVEKLSNGNYFITGNYADSIHNKFSVATLVLDSLLQPLSIRIIRDEFDLYCFDQLLSLDGGYILKNENIIIKTDSALNVIWANKYDFPIVQAKPINDLIFLADGGYLMCGRGIQLGKIDSIGVLQWVKNFQSNLSTSFNKMNFSSDQGISMIGNNNHMILVKLDSVISACGYNNYSNSIAVSNVVTNLRDSAVFFISDTTQLISYDSTMNFSFSFVETMICNSYTDVPEESQNKFIQIFPNPFSNHISVNMAESKLSDVRVLDVLGNAVAFRQSVNENDTILTLQFDELKSGIYLLQLTDKHGHMYTQKIACANVH